MKLERTKQIKKKKNEIEARVISYCESQPPRKGYLYEFTYIYVTFRHIKNLNFSVSPSLLLFFILSHFFHFTYSSILCAIFFFFFVSFSLLHYLLALRFEITQLKLRGYFQKKGADEYVHSNGGNTRKLNIF